MSKATRQPVRQGRHRAWDRPGVARAGRPAWISSPAGHVLLAVVTVSALLAACGDPCDDESGMTTCGYCGEDVVTSSSSHAGKCRYCAGSTNCTGDVCGDDLACEDRVRIYVPGARYHEGAAPSASETSAGPAVVQVTPSGGGMAMGSPVRFSVYWDVSVTVTVVFFAVAQLGGYYEVPVTEGEAAAGTVDIVVAEAADEPGESECQGPSWCWEEAPAATTTGDGTVSLVGGEGEVGPPTGGIGLTWEAPSYQQSPSAPSGNGCPTSAAQLGCCTTRGGALVLGAGLSAPCRCPAGTCDKGNGYCGCLACGGC